MKKTGMSLVIILITVITSFYLIYDYNTYRDKLKEQEESYRSLQPREVLESESRVENEEASDSVFTEEVEEAQISIGDEDMAIEDDTNKEDDLDGFDELDDIDDVENIVLEEETAAVFKINKETIPGKISLKDKSKLLKIAGKLSMIDYGNIVEIMNGYDEMGGATEIFNILKTRLKDEDYQEVKDILYPYVYVENIEDNMRNGNEK